MARSAAPAASRSASSDAVATPAAIATTPAPIRTRRHGTDRGPRRPALTPSRFAVTRIVAPTAVHVAPTTAGDGVARTETAGPMAATAVSGTTTADSRHRSRAADVRKLATTRAHVSPASAGLPIGTSACRPTAPVPRVDVGADPARCTT